VTETPEARHRSARSWRPVRLPRRVPAISILIRTKNEADSIGRLLDILEAQRFAGETEVILVDSGSDDGTVDLARDRVQKLIEIPASSFTFGRALNLGAEVASSPLIVALSAHAFPREDGYLARMAAHFTDERVACVTGAREDPDRAPLTAPLAQDLALAKANPFWGYSNAAGGFRADLWRKRPFREDLPGTEDKEWAWYWQQRGRVAIVDPALDVDHEHGRDPLGDCYRRARREWEGYAAYLDLDPLTPRGLLATWWSDQGFHASRWRARRDPWRAAALLGEWAGRRRGRLKAAR
jgi:rhamnosyltransferase